MEKTEQIGAARPVVVAFRNDRTIARVKNLLGAVQFAKHLNLPLHWVWNEIDVGAETRIPFDEIFVRKRITEVYPRLTISTMTEAEFDAAGYGAFDRRVSQNGEGASASHWQAWPHPSIWFDLTRALAIDDADLPTLRVAENATFERLPIQPKILNAVAEIERSCALSDTVGLHIRRGDVISGLHGISRAGLNRTGKERIAHKRLAVRGFVTRFAPDQAYHAAISDLPADQRLVFFSDTPKALDLFSDDYGDRAIDIRGALHSHDLTQTQIDFAEFLLLAKVKSMICNKSAYSLFAARLGNVPIKLIAPYIEPLALAGTVLTAVAGREDQDFAAKVYLTNCAGYFDKVKGQGAGEPLRKIAEAVSDEALPPKAVQQF